MNTGTTSSPIGAGLLADFRPLEFLWKGEAGSTPFYPSEQSAKWAVRQHRAALDEAKALALHRGRVFVHPQRFAQAIEQAAISAARARASGPSAGRP